MAIVLSLEQSPDVALLLLLHEIEYFLSLLLHGVSGSLRGVDRVLNSVDEAIDSWVGGLVVFVAPREVEEVLGNLVILGHVVVGEVARVTAM